MGLLLMFAHEKTVEVYPRSNRTGTLSEPLSGSHVMVQLFLEFSKSFLYDSAGSRKIFLYLGMRVGVDFLELVVTVSRVHALVGKLLEYQRFFSGHIFSFLLTFHHLDF
jgi:hypothetical protein